MPTSESQSLKDSDMADTPLLSIVVPFYNSVGKADRLLATLAGMSEPDVEFVLVDDGSTDGTAAYLRAHTSRMRCKCVLSGQENKGVGGARNHGLALASGKYVWFVDSDDDINPEVITIVRGLAVHRYDFIDFRVKHFAADEGRVRPSSGARAGALKLPEGEYSAEDVTRLSLLHTIGWPWTKVLNREFMIRNAFTYPEHCVYEELPSLFWLPLIVNRFYKSAVVAYYHHQEGESVTRSVGRKSKRFYDRLFTAGYAVDMTARFQCSRDERLRIEDKFTRIFLVHTIEMLIESGDWPLIPRVMKFYREEAKRLGIHGHPRRHASRRQMIALAAPWLLSYLYPSQRKFFETLHLQAWGRPIAFAGLNGVPQRLYANESTDALTEVSPART
jgi:glycosyltransferase involved in cell wall biosynthesis